MVKNVLIKAGRILGGLVRQGIAWSWYSDICASDWIAIGIPSPRRRYVVAADCKIKQERVSDGEQVMTMNQAYSHSHCR